MFRIPFRSIWVSSTTYFVLQTKQSFRVFLVFGDFPTCAATNRKSHHLFMIRIQFCTVWVPTNKIYLKFLRFSGVFPIFRQNLNITFRFWVLFRFLFDKQNSEIACGTTVSRVLPFYSIGNISRARVILRLRNWSDTRHKLNVINWCASVQNKPNRPRQLVTWLKLTKQ